MKFHVSDESISDKLVNKIFFIGKCGFYGGLITSSGLTSLTALSRIIFWISTGNLYHSSESVHMQASEFTKVMADLLTVFLYGLMFGIPIGLLTGVLIVIIWVIYRMIS